MIVKNIDNYSAVMTLTWMKSFAALFVGGMGIGEGVNGPVQNNALLNTFREMPVTITPYAVSDEIPNADLFIVKGQKYMSEKVHHSNLQRRRLETNL